MRVAGPLFTLFLWFPDPCPNASPIAHTPLANTDNSTNDPATPGVYKTIHEKFQNNKDLRVTRSQGHGSQFIRKIDSEDLKISGSKGLGLYGHDIQG